MRAAKAASCTRGGVYELCRTLLMMMMEALGAAALAVVERVVACMKSYGGYSSASGGTREAMMGMTPEAVMMVATTPEDGSGYDSKGSGGGSYNSRSSGYGSGYDSKGSGGGSYNSRGGGYDSRSSGYDSCSYGGGGYDRDDDMADLES